jgi:hypothetical protein
VAQRCSKSAKAVRNSVAEVHPTSAILKQLYTNSNIAMIDDAISLYNEIVSFYINRRDYFILNRKQINIVDLLKEIKSALQNDQERNSMITFHLISLRVADHFQSKEHISEFMKHLKDTLHRNSLLVRAKVDMGNKVLSLNNKRTIKLDLELNPCLEGFFEFVDVEFNLDTKRTFVN